MDYPPNSRKTQDGPPEKEKIERVTTADPIQRKKPLGKRFKETFISGDAKTAVNYVFFSVLLPAAKDALVEAGSQGMEKLVFGESRRRHGPSSGPMGHIAYNRMTSGGRPSPMGRPQMSRRARSQHDFDEIVLSSRQEAEDVLDRMFDLVSKYDAATVADLYELVGLKSDHTDHKWGWTDLRGASVTRLRGDQYLLDLNEPEPLIT